MSVDGIRMRRLRAHCMDELERIKVYARGVRPGEIAARVTADVTREVLEAVLRVLDGDAA